MINNCLVAFLKRSQLIEFCQTHNKKHISEIHVDFVNMNWISVMIYKTHLDYWFEERDFKDLVQEYHLNHLEKKNYAHMHVATATYRSVWYIKLINKLESTIVWSKRALIQLNNFTDDCIAS